MDIVTLGAALNGSAEYVNSHFKGGSNIQIVDNPDGTQTINASGEVSAEDTVARAEIAEMKDGTTIDSFGDVETALATKANASTTYTKTEVDTALSAKANSADVYSKTAVDTVLGNKADKSTTYTKTEVDTALDDKVDKETGKGLSTNDYTTAEKTKLAGIAEGAEVNVQANWTQTTTTADDYIKNKPTLGTAAAKNATDTYNATGTDVTTGKAVAEALATLPEPMVFKGSLGTGGTITTLPTASSSNKGYVYKVITSGTYASQSAKVGDTFISDGSAWVLIPSGDEPSGTVTNVAVANGGGLTVSGSPITSSGTITVGHSNSVTAKTSSSLKKFTYDEHGHVTDSSELSTAESNALASGIDSAKVEQIETNKNNILWNVNNGVKNIIKNTATSSGIFTVNADGTIKAQGTTGSSRAFITVSTILASEAYKLNGMILNGCPSGGELGGYRINLQLFGDDFPNYAICRGDDVVISGIPQNPPYNLRLIVAVEARKTVDVVFKPMISITGGEYQPYAMSNAELTKEIETDEAALVELVDGGAKNIIEVADAVCTRNGVTATLNSDGSIVLSGKAEGASNDFLICNNLKTGSQTSSYTPLVPIKSGNYVISGLSDSRLNLEVLNFNSSSDVNTFGGTEFIATKQYIDFRLMVEKTADFTTPLTIYPMCCTKAAWDISQAYQPYRPSYQELTEANRRKVYANTENTTSYTFSNLYGLDDSRFKYALVCGGGTANNPALAMAWLIFIDDFGVVTARKIIGDSTRTLTGSVSGTTLTLTTDSKMYGGLRLIWLS